MNVEIEIREMRDKLEILESHLKKPKGLYSWSSIESVFKLEMPIISNEALAKFKERLESSDLGTIPTWVPPKTSQNATKKRKNLYERRERIPGTPKAHDMTSPIVDYLKTCKNMTASKKEIYDAIKVNYPKHILSIPHRKGGIDVPGVTLVEYRINWAAWVLTANNKAVGPRKDPSLPEGHIRLVDTKKFTDEEINYLKRNKGYVKGFTRSSGAQRD